jgi:hypothetical protein
MKSNFQRLYNLEHYILTDVRQTYLQVGHLSAFDFFCIVIWKANRAKSKIARRLLEHNANLEDSVKNITSEVYKASTSKEKIRILIKDYGFRLPMASAILTVLYPKIFTVYDIRVCDTLCNFKDLGNTVNFEKLWACYQSYIKAVKECGPANLSLREKDRFLWGKSFYTQLKMDINDNFKSNDEYDYR